MHGGGRDGGDRRGGGVLRLAAKDMRLALEAADHAATALPTALPTAAAVRRWLDVAADQGAADLDFSAVVATILGRPAGP